MENSLDDDIAQAMSQVAGESEEVVESSENEETLELTDESQSEVSEDSQDEVEVLAAPINWKSETREYFNSLDDSGKELFMDHYKNLESGYNKKYEDVAKERKNYESISEVLEPIRMDFTSQGLDDAGAVRYLTSMYQQLVQNPEDTIRLLAEQTGVDLGSSTETYDYDFDENQGYDPRYDSIEQKLKETQSKLDQYEQSAKQSQMQQIVAQVQEFKAQKDPSGNLKNPLFDQVQGKMTQLFQTGAASTLDEAYIMAVAADKELSAKQRQLEKEAEAKERAQAAKRAERAARGVKGSNATSVEANQPTDLREMIAQQVRAARSN